MRGNLFVGFLTGGQLGDLGSSLSWAEEHGFKSISIAAPPQNNILNIPEVLSDPTRVKAVLRDSKAIVSAIGFYGNPIHNDLATRKANKDYFIRVVEACHKLEVPVATGWIGLYQGSVEDNVREFKKEWPDIVRKAEDLGVKIAIENCTANIAYRPDIWEKLFEAIPSSSLGLEFDPSHLIFQLMDAVEVADRFGDRIFHTHMKDGQILWKRVSQYGMESGGVHLHRLPGFGDLNWAQFISVLKKHHYDYALSIEHEDPYFGYAEGLVLARKFLDRFVVDT
jgi:sugar phosphate isomerase/epimerase